MRNLILGCMVLCSLFATPRTTLAQTSPPHDGVPNTAAQQDPTERLAAALRAAKSNQERASLLESQKALVTQKLAQILLKSGGALRLRGDYAAAETAYGLSQTVSEQVGDKSGIASAIRSLGIVQRMQGNYVGALTLYRQALAIYEPLGNKMGIARSLS